MVIAVLGAILVGLGSGYALWTYRKNLPDKVWIPLTNFNPPLTEEQQAALAGKLKKELLEGAVMADVVKDVGLAAKLKLPSDQAAEDFARSHFYVEPGVAPGGTPSIDIGFTCQRKSQKVMGEVATRLMEDVGRILKIRMQAGGVAF